MILRRLQSEGVVQVGADVARVRVLPRNEGPMAYVSLAPVIVAEGLRATVRRKGDRTTLEVEIDSRSLHVTSANIRPWDRAKIEELVRDNLLDSTRHPVVRYEGIFDDGWETAPEVRVHGTLELRGLKRPLDLDFVRKGSSTWRASACVHQSEFRIQPVSAFMGALRSSDCVDIEISVGGDFAGDGDERS